MTQKRLLGGKNMRGIHFSTLFLLGGHHSGADDSFLRCCYYFADVTFLFAWHNHQKDSKKTCKDKNMRGIHFSTLLLLGGFHSGADDSFLRWDYYIVVCACYAWCYQQNDSKKTSMEQKHEGNSFFDFVFAWWSQFRGGWQLFDMILLYRRFDFLIRVNQPSKWLKKTSSGKNVRGIHFLIFFSLAVTTQGRMTAFWDVVTTL